MPYILLTLLLALAAWAWLRSVPPEGRRSALITMGLGGLIVVFGLVAATGRLPALLGSLAAAVPFLRRVVPGFLLWSWWQRWRDRFGTRGASQDSRQQGTAGSGRLSRQEALDVLGLTGDPEVETIRQAHKRLIQKVHPDQGGNEYLAARINEARAVLLEPHRNSS